MPAKKDTPKAQPVAVVAEEPVAEVLEKKVPGAGAWEIPIPDGAILGGLPEGTFLSKCNEEPKETTSSKGDPQTEFTYEITDPEYPDLLGKTGKYWCSRKPKSWWNMTNTLDAMNVVYEIIKDEAGKPRTFRFDPMDCIGAVCKIVVKARTDPSGRTRNVVAQVISATESDVESSGPEEEGPPF